MAYGIYVDSIWNFIHILDISVWFCILQFPPDLSRAKLRTIDLISLLINTWDAWYSQSPVAIYVWPIPRVMNWYLYIILFHSYGTNCHIMVSIRHIINHVVHQRLSIWWRFGDEKKPKLELKNIYMATIIEALPTNQGVVCITIKYNWMV